MKCGGGGGGGGGGDGGGEGRLITSEVTLGTDSARAAKKPRKRTNNPASRGWDARAVVRGGCSCGREEGSG